jgi:hypothetical protein
MELNGGLRRRRRLKMKSRRLASLEEIEGGISDKRER